MFPQQRMQRKRTSSQAETSDQTFSSYSSSKKHPRRSSKKFDSRGKRVGRADQDLWWRKGLNSESQEKSTPSATKASKLKSKESRRTRGKKPRTTQRATLPSEAAAVTLYQYHLNQVSRLKAVTQDPKTRNFLSILEQLPVPDRIEGLPPEISRDPLSPAYP